MRDDDGAATGRVKTAIPQERSKIGQCNFIVSRDFSEILEILISIYLHMKLDSGSDQAVDLGAVTTRPEPRPPPWVNKSCYLT